MIKKLLLVTTILLAVTLSLMAADASGKWVFEQEGRGGTMQVTLNLKVDGNNISFSVKREFNGNSFVITYKGTLDGDSLKIEISRPGRDGNTRTTNAVAKRITT